MPPLHDVRLTPLEVLDQLVDVVDALPRRVARRQPQPRGVVQQLQVRSRGRLHDLNKQGRDSTELFPDLNFGIGEKPRPSRVPLNLLAITATATIPH